MSVDTLEFSNVTRDETPPQEFEYACVVCGREIFYGGRGRKPKYCDEHRTGNSPNKDSVRSKTKITGGTAQLAAQATEALIQVNGLIAILLMVFKMPMTASAIEAAKDGFRESTYAALLTDPELCRTILKAGTTSGKIALLISYAMLAAAVVPVGILEFKENQKDKEVPDENWSPVKEPTIAS